VPSDGRTEVVGADEAEELRRLCLLFPELATTSATGDPMLLESELQPSNTHERLRVSLADIWLATLRLLVNAVHNNPDIVNGFLGLEGEFDSLTSNGTLTFVLDVFISLHTWRSGSSEGHTTQKGESPMEVSCFLSFFLSCYLFVYY
jgi:hypothetical protein